MYSVLPIATRAEHLAAVNPFELLKCLRSATGGPWSWQTPVRGIKNDEMVRGFRGYSVGRAPAYHVRRDDADFVVFCFAKPEDAPAFAERFGGERLPETRRR